MQFLEILGHQNIHCPNCSYLIFEAVNFEAPAEMRGNDFEENKVIQLILQAILK